MKWPFLRTKQVSSEESITDALDKIHEAVEARAEVQTLDKMMDDRLESLNASIKRNHFVDALLPSLTPKETRHGLAH